jgi:hypothetical protein
MRVESLQRQLLCNNKLSAMSDLHRPERCLRAQRHESLHDNVHTDNTMLRL